jgi:hypothetical protein
MAQAKDSNEYSTFNIKSNILQVINSEYLINNINTKVPKFAKASVHRIKTTNNQEFS